MRRNRRQRHVGRRRRCRRWGRASDAEVKGVSHGHVGGGSPVSALVRDCVGHAQRRYSLSRGSDRGLD
eukprot:1684594-Pleurochrysis_carterae.AAC.1